MHQWAGKKKIKMDGQNIQTSDSKEIPCDTDIDGFKLLGRGIGIDEKEFYIITHSAADCLNKKIEVDENSYTYLNGSNNFDMFVYTASNNIKYKY